MLRRAGRYPVGIATCSAAPRAATAGALCCLLISGGLTGATGQTKPPAPPAANKPPAQSTASQQHKPTPAPSFQKGVLYGAVMDPAGKPVAGAMVALRDKRGRVLAWTTTNSDGRYALAANPVRALNLGRSRHRGLLAQIANAIGQVAMTPLRVAASAAKVVKSAASMKTVESIAVSAALGNPMPTIAQVVGSTVDTVRGVKAQAIQSTKVTAVQAAFQDPAAGGVKSVSRAAGRGAVTIAVSAAGYKSVQGTAGAAWMAAPEGAGAQAVGERAWLDNVNLAPNAAKANSGVAPEPIVLADARVEPDMVPVGGTVKVTVKLLHADPVLSEVRVFAREAKRKTVLELFQTQAGGPGVFEGELRLDPHTPVGETTISIAALHATPVNVKIPASRSDDTLSAFVGRLDDLDPKGPFWYDPRIMAAENRLDVPLTVLSPAQQTPPTGATPASPTTPTTPPPPAAKPATTPAQPKPAAPPKTSPQAPPASPSGGGTPPPKPTGSP